MATIFRGTRVVDLTEGMSGSVTTMILADNGAEVVKIEPPGGDPSRTNQAWLMWNRGKKSVVVDLNSAAGRKNAQALVKSADVFVQNFRPGEAEKLGLGYEDVSKANPALVYLSISAIGSKGRYKNLKLYDGVVMAKTGEYARGGARPQYRVRPLGSWAGANMAVSAIAGALYVRARTGKGQKVESSLYQGLLCYNFNGSVGRQQQLNMLEKPQPTPAGGLAPGGQTVNLPYSVVRTKDGRWIQMTNLAARLFPHWIKAMDLDHIYEDPRFKGAPFLFNNEEDKKALRKILVERMVTKTADEWIELFKKHDVGGEPILTTEQAIDHPQLLYENGVVDIVDPTVGPMKQIGPLVQFSETTSRVTKPAPQLGQHTRAVLASLQNNGHSPIVKGTKPLPKHPFAGVTVLDFGGWLAAPAGTAFFADLGARVIKIEPPGGEEWRRNTKGVSHTFDGKESMIVNLKTPEGREVISKLIAKADAIMHNLRDGVEELGIDYPTMRKINPKIVYLYAGSYGSKGPGAGRPAFGPIAAAVSGSDYWGIGKGNTPPPADAPMTTDEIIEQGVQLYQAFGAAGSPDITSAVAVSTALSLGLYAREVTGKGQYMESSMLFSNCYCCSEDFMRFDTKQPRLNPDKELRGLHALHRLYETKDGWVFLQCPKEDEWKEFCKAIDRQDLLKEPRYNTPVSRLTNDDQLIGQLAPIFKTRSADDWENDLLKRDIMCVRADKPGVDDFFLSDPAVKENGFSAAVNHPVLGKSVRVGPPSRFSLTPSRAEPPVLFGQNTQAIMADLGYSKTAIAELKAKGIVGWETESAK